MDSVAGPSAVLGLPAQSCAESVTEAGRRYNGAAPWETAIEPYPNPSSPDCMGQSWAALGHVEQEGSLIFSFVQ